MGKKLSILIGVIVILVGIDVIIRIGSYQDNIGSSEYYHQQQNFNAGASTTDLDISGYASSTGYIILPFIKFRQNSATPTTPATGDCFMPNAQLKCYNGSNWIKYSGTAE